MKLKNILYKCKIFITKYIFKTMLTLQIVLLITFYLLNKYDIFSVEPILEFIYFIITCITMQYLHNNNNIFTKSILVTLPILYIVLFTKMVILLTIPLILYGTLKCDSNFLSKTLKRIYIYLFSFIFILSLLYFNASGASLLFSSKETTLSTAYSPNGNYRIVTAKGNGFKGSHIAIYLEKNKFKKIFYKRLDKDNPIAYEYYRNLRYVLLKLHLIKNGDDVTKGLTIKWKNNTTFFILNKKMNINNIHDFNLTDYLYSQLSHNKYSN